jgi:hypothetical protein
MLFAIILAGGRAGRYNPSLSPAKPANNAAELIEKTLTRPRTRQTRDRSLRA